MVNAIHNGCCSLDALCPAHLEDAVAQLRGVAQARGWELAANARSEWPDGSDVLRRIARRAVADLGRDPDLIERLAEEAERGARKRTRG